MSELVDRSKTNNNMAALVTIAQYYSSVIGLAVEKHMEVARNLYCILWVKVASCF